jgi:hypothetical protein
MVSIRSTVTVTQKGDMSGHLAKIMAATKGPSTVKVGFPAGKAPGDMVSIAFWNHYGTSRIPHRPFITMALFKGRGQIRGALRAHAKAMMSGTMSMEQALPLLGLQGQTLVQNQIGSNMPPPNAPSTIRQKGSSRTLIDSGRMIGAVTWAMNQ